MNPRDDTAYNSGWIKAHSCPVTLRLVLSHPGFFIRRNPHPVAVWHIVL
jgi:hypothetical protein